MNCKHAHKLINKSTDGLASPEEKASLEGHLSTCPRCAEEYAAVSSLDGLLAKALPLQETLGDGFAARVSEKLPACGSRLPILKEAFVMSRTKYVVLAVVVLAIVIGCLFATGSKNNQVLAAVQSAMAKVESLHYRIAPPAGPKPPNRQAEVWLTRDAFKLTDKDKTQWHIIKGGAQYYYLSSFKVMIILPTAWDTATVFGAMLDPREIVNLTKESETHVSVKVQDTERNGKPKKQIEVERTGTPSKETQERSNRIFQKLAEIMQEQLHTQGKKGKVATTRHRIVGKEVYFVDPTTNLVQSVEYFAKGRENGEWQFVARVASIDYNVDLPDDFFDVKTPPGTKVYDLRD